jgi:hypothetical protein
MSADTALRLADDTDKVSSAPPAVGIISNGTDPINGIDACGAFSYLWPSASREAASIVHL